MSNTSVEKPVHVAGTITIIGITLARSIHYISSLFMLAYLSPEVIGEFAFAMFLMLTIYTLLTTGIESRIIAIESQKSFLAESWTIELLRGCLTLLIILFVCIYAFYNNFFSLIYQYLIVLGIGMLIRCGRNINMVTSRRALNMLPIFYVELGSAICLLVISVSLVTIYQSGWALAFGYLSGSIAYTFLSFKFLPREGSVLKFNLNRFREIFSYSKWLMFSAQIVSFFENIVPLLISQMFGSAALGFFERSDLYSRKIIAQITQVFWIVGLPWASRSSRNNRKFDEILSLILLFFVVLALPLLAALSIFVPKILVFVGGLAWSGTEDIVRALCVVSVISCFSVPFGIVMQAIKLPNLTLWSGVVKLSVFILILIVWGYENILDFIYTLALANLFSLAFYFMATFQVLKINVLEIIIDSLLLSLPFILFHFVGYELIFDSNIVNQLILVISFFLINTGFCLSVIARKKEVRRTMLNILRQILNTFRSIKS